MGPKNRQLFFWRGSVGSLETDFVHVKSEMLTNKKM